MRHIKVLSVISPHFKVHDPAMPVYQLPLYRTVVLRVDTEKRNGDDSLRFDKLRASQTLKQNIYLISSSIFKPPVFR